MPLFEVKGGKMNLRMAPTPAPWPEESNTMYHAALFGIPVTVKLQSEKGTVFFDIDGLSEEGDFLIPCISASKCRSTLAVMHVEIPEQLSSSNASLEK